MAYCQSWLLQCLPLKGVTEHSDYFLTFIKVHLYNYRNLRIVFFFNEGVTLNVTNTMVTVLPTICL